MSSTAWMNPDTGYKFGSPRDFLSKNRYTIGGLIGQLGGQLTGNPTAPYDQAMNEGNKYYQNAIDTQRPFYNAGTSAIPEYQNYLKGMSNPTDFVNNIMGQYSESPWAKIQQQRAIQANNNMASAAGLVGSTPWQQTGEQYARDISSADQNQWLNNVLGVNTSYGNGLNNLLNYGFNSGNIMSKLFGQQADTNANLAFGKGSADENDNSTLWGNIGQLAKLFL